MGLGGLIFIEKNTGQDRLKKKKNENTGPYSLVQMKNSDRTGLPKILAGIGQKLSGVNCSYIHYQTHKEKLIFKKLTLVD